MNFSPSRKSASFTACRPTSSEDGSKGSASEPNLASQAEMASSKDMSPGVQAGNQEPSTTSGTRGRRPPSWTPCVIHAPITIRSNGSIGQELLDADGQVIVWTTDPVLAQVIARLLNENSSDA